MAIPILAAATGAAAAYRTAQGLGEAGAAAAGAAGSFGDALGRAVQGAIQTGHRADASATAALTGSGSVTDVVLAISRAELALQTATAVRDRVVTAYQDVMRMPI
jgi:flagellar hook-basal body complex protein FliE